MSEPTKRKTLLDSFLENATPEQTLPAILGTELSKAQLRQLNELVGMAGFSLLIHLLSSLRQEIVEATLEAGPRVDSDFYRLQGMFQLAKEIESIPEAIIAAGPLNDDNKETS